MKIDSQTDFGTRECPGCAVSVPTNENRCPICGYEFPHLTGYRGTRLGAAVLMLLILAALLFRLL